MLSLIETTEIAAFELTVPSLIPACVPVDVIAGDSAPAAVSASGKSGESEPGPVIEPASMYASMLNESYKCIFD